jgi:hypothetical protein
MALSQNEPNAIVCCEDSQIYGLSGLCSLPKVRLEEECCRVLPAETGPIILITFAQSNTRQVRTILILTR